MLVFPRLWSNLYGRYTRVPGGENSTRLPRNRIGLRHMSETMAGRPEWFSKVGLQTTDLECGSYRHPIRNRYTEWFQTGSSTKRSILTVRVSMLFFDTALQLGIHRNYIQSDHLFNPAKKVLEKSCDVELSKNEPAIDGCSVPTCDAAWKHSDRDVCVGEQDQSLTRNFVRPLK